MYADRVESGGDVSIKDRLNGKSGNDSIRRHQFAGKRQRQDDKWQHDLYKGGEAQASRGNIHPRDLRLKLQNKGFKKESHSGKGGVRDLREMLSGTMNSQPDPPKAKMGVAKPARKSVAVEASEPEPKRNSSSAAKKKTQQKADTSVEGFLQSLSLDKYVITFQAEEVDMSALVHMTDGDLKALGIPMGPRKKILLALESRG